MKPRPPWARYVIVGTASGAAAGVALYVWLFQVFFVRYQNTSVETAEKIVAGIGMVSPFVMVATFLYGLTAPFLPGQPTVISKAISCGVFAAVGTAAEGGALGALAFVIVRFLRERRTKSGQQHQL